MTLAGATLGLLVSINILTINILLAKLDIIPFMYPDKIRGSFLSISIVMIIVFYYQGKRGKKIIEKYTHWKKKDRIKGTWVTILYIIATYGFLSVLYYKQGYLPTISF
jgi:hypothetical protein